MSSHSGLYQDIPKKHGQTWPEPLRHRTTRSASQCSALLVILSGQSPLIRRHYLLCHGSLAGNAPFAVTDSGNDILTPTMTVHMRAEDADRLHRLHGGQMQYEHSIVSVSFTVSYFKSPILTSFQTQHIGMDCEPRYLELVQQWITRLYEAAQQKS